MATKEELQRLKDIIDCRELVQSFGIELKSGNISCLNPSHPDKNPSMAVYKNHALCFGCNLNLDAIGIVQALKTFSFKESLDYLFSKYTFNNDFLKKENKPYSKNNTLIKQFKEKNIITDKYENKYKDTSIKESIWKIIEPLEPTKEAISWLTGRKISVDVAWKLGCRDITPVLKKIECIIENTSNEILKENNFLNSKGDLWSPLLNKIRGYNEYSGLIIPIFYFNSKIHSFRWRFFNSIQRNDSILKVLGQPTNELIPIGLNFASNLERKESIYICEGEPDWLSFHTYFSENNITNRSCIGLCVLSNQWQPDWTKILSGYNQIYICLHDTKKAEQVCNSIAISLLKLDYNKIDYWKKNFFRKLLSEKNDANDLLQKYIFGDFLGF